MRVGPLIDALPSLRIGLALAAAVSVAAVAGAVVWFGAARYDSGFQAGSDKANLAHAKADRQAREIAAEDLRLKNRANSGVTDAFRSRLQAAESSATRYRTEHQRLLDDAARLRQAASAPSAGPIADAAATLGGLLGECSSRRAEVSRSAETLSAQVIGLQDYVTKVCQPETPE